jgi:cobalt-zinc-cadmium efflux system protein
MAHHFDHAHHEHDHSHKPRELHDPSHRRDENANRLIIVLSLTLVFFFVETLGGFWTNSLALLSDAAHMLSDIAALGLSLFAIWISRKPAHGMKTFGYYRAEILAAFVNGVTLVVIALVIFHEAMARIANPQVIKGIPMLMIAALGLMVNLIGAAILSRGEKENINIRGVLIHVIGDALGSVGAICAGVAVWLKGWNWFDPLVSFFIGSIIIYSAWRLLWDTLHILMQGVPPHINMEEIRESMMKTEGVESICDLHIWTLTSHVEMLSAHVVVSDFNQGMTVLKDLHTVLREKHGLEHVTLQIEDASLGTCNLFV